MKKIIYRSVFSLIILAFSFIKLLNLFVLIPVDVSNIKIATTMVIIKIIIIETNLRI